MRGNTIAGQLPTMADNTGRSEINFFYSSIKPGRRLKKSFLKKFSFKHSFHHSKSEIHRENFIQKSIMHTKYLFDSKYFFDSKGFSNQHRGPIPARIYTSSGPFLGSAFGQHPQETTGFIRVWHRKGGGIWAPPAGLRPASPVPPKQFS